MRLLKQGTRCETLTKAAPVIQKETPKKRVDASKEPVSQQQIKPKPTTLTDCLCERLIHSKIDCAAMSVRASKRGRESEKKEVPSGVVKPLQTPNPPHWGYVGERRRQLLLHSQLTQNSLTHPHTPTHPTHTHTHTLSPLTPPNPHRTLSHNLATNNHVFKGSDSLLIYF